MAGAWVLSRPSGIPDPIQIGAFGAVGALPFGATITPSAKTTSALLIVATSGIAFAIAAPLNVVSGQTLLFTIKNTSGGALGAATWNAIYKLAAWTNPATGNSRSITFLYNGVNLIEVSRTTTDVPN